MQDIKRNKRKMMQQVPIMATKSNNNDIEDEVLVSDEISRGCKKSSDFSCKQKNDDCGCHNHNHDCDCDCNKHHDCDCDCDCDCNDHHHDCKCEPCEIEHKNCVKNPCGPNCVDPFTPANFSTANSVPFAIETNRIFDTMAFQIFADGVAGNGSPLSFIIDVVEVFGPVPRVGDVEVKIEKVCINYDKIRIDTGDVTLEDFDVDPIGDTTGENCQSNFESVVCGPRDEECCRQCKNKSVAFKERGLRVEVDGLVLELRGKCGCTEFIALAFPAIKRTGCKKEQICTVEFPFNTLSAPIGVPADGRSFILRQDFQTSLTVDCIGKAILSYECYEGEGYFDLDIPNGIDIICCLQEIVSTLVSEQLVVLGSPNAVSPRIVDTFSKVCDFPDCTKNCPPRDKHKDKDKGCGCVR